ncbi:phosphoethanolamine transferase [uncultured Polaribacter sp.]|uniref:phosphoethanolamine transferase n=1 Tax=uncultured Polaribacter sp. TaxID=174711 RepID=UPI0026109B82|nr:phosphoethanolamine transferase [uncultured Polaribacter sp.]
MEKINKYKHEFTFHILLNIIIAFFISAASYIHIPFGSTKGVLVYCIHFVILQFTIFGFIYVYTLFKTLFKFTFPILFSTLSALAFWVYTQDITLESSIIQAILETKLDIAIDTLSFPFVIYVISAFLVSFFLMKRFQKLQLNNIKSPLFLIAIVAIISFFIAENYRFGVLKRKLPYNSFVSVKNYLTKPEIRLKEPENNITGAKENLHIIFVLGESVRADHLTLNGYYRNTTPLLSLQENIVSFKNIYTPLTYTAVSVPQILTNKATTDISKTSFYSVYSILNKADFYTDWIGNQTLEKSYEAIVKTNKKVTIIDQFHSVLSFKKKKDLALLEQFSLHNTNHKNRLSTIHMIGSHWYYNSKYTKEFEKFTPITNSKYVGSLSKEQLINSYDNTILYLDYFLNELIEELKKSSKETLLIYLSDHGEILGENGQWFHAQKNNASENPAMLVWYSENFKNKNPLIVKNVISNQQQKFTTDFLFHSILDVSKIKGFKIDNTQSIFSDFKEFKKFN